MELPRAAQELVGVDRGAAHQRVILSRCPAAPGVPKTKWELRNPERSRCPVPGPVKDKQREGLAGEALTDRSQCD